MSQIVKLEIPEVFFKPLQRTAKATKQPIEKILLNALQTSLPSLEGLPNDFIENLTSLENLGDEELRKVLTEQVSAENREKISALINKSKKNSLKNAESEMLDNLQKRADLTMLRKARAAVLLRFRGQRLPTLAELEQTR